MKKIVLSAALLFIPLASYGQNQNDSLNKVIAKLKQGINTNGTLTFGSGSVSTFQAWIDNAGFDSNNTNIECATDSADCSKGFVIFTMPSNNGPICHVKTRSVNGPKTMYYTGPVKTLFAINNGMVEFLPIAPGASFPKQSGQGITAQPVTVQGISLPVLYLTSQFTYSNDLTAQPAPDSANDTDKKQYDQKLWDAASKQDPNARQVIESRKDLCGLAVFNPKPN